MKVAYVVVLFIIAWLAVMGAVFKQHEEERRTERSCSTACDPYTSRLIDGVCHCRGQGGWVEKK